MKIKYILSHLKSVAGNTAVALAEGLKTAANYTGRAIETAIQESETRARAAALAVRKQEYIAQLQNLEPYYNRMVQALGDLIAVYHTVCGLVVPKNLVDLYPAKMRLLERIAVRNGFVAFRYEVVRKHDMNLAPIHEVTKLLGAQFPKYALQYGFTYRKLRVREGQGMGPERIVVDVIGVRG